MNKVQYNAHQTTLFEDCLEICHKAQAEYTMNDNPFDNFERIASELGLSREVVLLVYMKKHIDGVVNYVKNGKEQRDSMRGRIIDTINYLCLLAAMNDFPARTVESFEDIHKLSKLSLTENFPSVTKGELINKYTNPEE